MDKSIANAEEVFGRAIELSSGAARDQFVNAQCDGNPALRGEVESLLRAHQSAGSFLRLPEPPHRTAPPKNSSQGTAILSAAAYADAFLRDGVAHDPARVENYVVSLPDSVRRETLERIQTALRVR